MNEKYEEIINLSHHTSSVRAPMPRADRAAQFAPYSALSGYEDAVEETARITDTPIELDEYEKEQINGALTSLLSSTPHLPCWPWCFPGGPAWPEEPPPLGNCEKQVTFSTSVIS